MASQHSPQTRETAPVRRPLGVPRAGADAAPRLSRGELAALEIIRAAIAAGQRCPSNLDLIAAAGDKRRWSGPKILQALVDAGLITVRSRNHRRIVTDVASGKSTAEGGRRYVIGAVHAPITDAPPPGPDRSPCPRCGVRADIGCGHGWLPRGLVVRT